MSYKEEAAGREALRHRLFTPLTIGTLTIPNRIVMPALHLVYCADGTVTDRLAAFYARRAKGGAGLLIVGGCAVDRRGYSAGMIGLHSPAFQPGLRRLTDVIHENGGLAAAQLFQSGRYAKPSVTGQPGLAPSAVYSSYSRATPEAMTVAQMEETAGCFARAAALAADSGFDAVELIASAGYLLSSFVSPITNLRTDEFGGSRENRFRFPGMVMDAVRAALPPGYPILVRIAGNEFMPGGNEQDEAAAFARFLELRGAAAINVTGGWHETAVPQLTGHLPPAGFAYLAASARDAVSIPVFASNRINSMIDAERLLAIGAADAVCMGRQLICDPDTPRKTREGREDEILPCVACGQGCADHTFAGRALGCALNPEAGAEHRLPGTRAKRPLRVLVAGGGAAGMAAAAEAAARGYHVTLFERTQTLGGQLTALSSLHFLSDCRRLLEVLRQQMQVYGVEIRTGQELTAPMAQALAPDFVIIATGTRPLPLPDRAGFCGELCSVQDVLRGTVVPGRRVVVLGSAQLGLETALFLKRNAAPSPELLEFLSFHDAQSPKTIASMRASSRREVTVVTEGKNALQQVGISTRWVMRKECMRYGIETVCDVREATLTLGGVRVTQGDCEPALLPADTVVIAARSPDGALVQALGELGIPCRAVGSAASAGAGAYVVGAARHIAMHLESITTTGDDHSV